MGHLTDCHGGVMTHISVHRCTLMGMSMMTITDARACLPELADRVQTGEEVTLTRHGQPVMVLVHPDSLSVRRSSSIWDETEKVRRRLEEARTRPLSETGVSPEFAEELVKSIRAERDER